MSLPIDELEHLLNQARTELVGVSDAGLKATLYDVLNEFFTDSNAWTETLSLTANANVQTFSLIPTQGGQIIRLVGVFDPNLVAQAAFMADFGTLGLVNAFTTTTALTVIVAKTVTRSENSREMVPNAPDWTLKVYYSYIFEGLLGRLMSQVNKSYSNQPAASYHLKRFRVGIQNARTAAARQNTYGAQSWRFPRGWGSQGQRGSISTGFPTAF